MQQLAQKQIVSPLRALRILNDRYSTLSSAPSQSLNAYAEAARSCGLEPLDNLPMPSFIVSTAREQTAPQLLQEAIKMLKSGPERKFDESVELALNLSIDPRRGDQMVRGAAPLPHGTGRRVRVAVFAQSSAAEAARAAGADIIGSEDLIEKIQESGGGGLEFDRAVATPDMMPKLGKIARILGPRGLMPNPKLGTVTEDVAEAVSALKRGRVEFRADKGGVVHAGIGRRSFDDEALLDNVSAFVAAVLAARPKGVKGSGAGGYIAKATLSSTMGRGIPVQVSNLVSCAQARK